MVKKKKKRDTGGSLSGMKQDGKHDREIEREQVETTGGLCLQKPSFLINSQQTE